MGLVISKYDSYFGYLIPWYLTRQTCTILCMAKPSNLHAGDKLLVQLGTAIRHLRAEQGLSQEGLAEAAELDRSYVGGIERGEHNLTIMNLRRIADALGKKPSKLLDSSGY